MGGLKACEKVDIWYFSQLLLLHKCIFQGLAFYLFFAIWACPSGVIINYRWSEVPEEQQTFLCAPSVEKVVESHLFRDWREFIQQGKKQ